jgi:putative addiction module CopG family antidote
MLKVSFPEIDTAYLRHKVESGYFTSVSEAIRDAVRKQRESEQQRLLNALEVGEQAIRDGQTEIFTRDLFDATIRQGIEQGLKGKLAHNPDIIPE